MRKEEWNWWNTWLSAKKNCGIPIPFPLQHRYHHEHWTWSMNMHIKLNAMSRKERRQYAEPDSVRIFPAQQTCATQLHLDGSMPRFSDMDWDSMRELKLATPYKPVASLPCIEATTVGWQVKKSRTKRALTIWDYSKHFIAWWVWMIQLDLDWISSSSLFSRL